MLDKSLQFIQLLRYLEKVERVIYRPDGSKENDIEHSYQIAMMAWFLSDQLGLNLSKEKLLTYGLVHDLIEVYAGDVPAYTKNKELIAQKEENEKRALEKLKDNFGHFPTLIGAIEEYEKKEDEESVFIYEVDKLVPIFNLYIDKGYGWNKLGLSLEEIKKEKRKKVTSTKELVDLLEETLSRLEKEEETLFDKKS